MVLKNPFLFGKDFQVSSTVCTEQPMAATRLSDHSWGTIGIGIGIGIAIAIAIAIDVGIIALPASILRRPIMHCFR